MYSGQGTSFLCAGFFFAACLSFTQIVGHFGSDCLLWSAQYLAPYLPSECLWGSLRIIVIQIMRIRNQHWETCFSAGIAARIYRSQLGCAWKRTCLVYLIFVFSDCLVLFLGRLSVVVTSHDSTMVTGAVSLPLAGFFAL